MKHSHLRSQLTCLMFLILASGQAVSAAAPNDAGKLASVLELSVEPGSPVYAPAEVAELYGTVALYGLPLPDTSVTITVFDPADTLLSQSLTATDSQGDFYFAVPLPFDTAQGQYIVHANTSFARAAGTATTSFAVFSPIFRVETDKPEYFRGEEVTITLFNGHSSAVEINGVPPFGILTYPELEPVFPRFIAFIVWYVEAGETQTWGWEQDNEFEGRLADPGLYIVLARTVFPLDQEPAIFTIIASGDLNHDGTIDIADIALVGSAYGSQEGDANWNPEADVAPPYGIVNLYDLTSIAYHYGESW